MTVPPKPLQQHAADEKLSGELSRLQAKLRLTEGELSTARKLLGGQESELDALRRLAEYHGRPLKPPRFLSSARSTKGEHEAIIATMLSDMHFDEVVNPDELNGLNAYNRKIGEQRLEKYFAGMVKLTHGYLAGVKYSGIVFMLGGDGLSGDIHDDLRETNETTALDGMFHWARKIASGIEFWLEEFPGIPVYIPVVVGNHPRLTMKPRSKKAARDNLDWGIGQLLATHFKDNPLVTFDITDGTGVRFNIYSSRFLLSHGDKPKTNGGHGIGGIWPTIFRNRGKVLSQWVHDPFQVWLNGHWHQLVPITSGLGINGSLKGWDEWTASMGFTPETPQQMLFTVTPERGITFQAPIQVCDPKKEGWG